MFPTVLPLTRSSKQLVGCHLDRVQRGDKHAEQRLVIEISIALSDAKSVDGRHTVEEAKPASPTPEQAASAKVLRGERLTAAEEAAILFGGI